MAIAQHLNPNPNNTMSTRSTIAIQAPNGTIRKVYCHFDGYISNNGMILSKHINTYDKWTALVHGGDLSGFERFTADDNTIHYTPRHYKDMEGRGNEEPMFPETYANLDAWKASIDHLFHEYNYIMLNNGSAWVIEGNYKKPEKAKLKQLNRVVGKTLAAIAKRRAATAV